ncbi:4-hydroxy-tetrahydrodipicolinate synthase [Cupriavidus yeoncheonensis]|uniref:4-hydroxy-tetrahydrodipicolinate synthase n=1 Tax=Cupriavidus yeoncheonensis TaxID=1462994 RepID=A0A916IWP6_9BURK|nr:4-hydroxy-tetrahydrodipicolinate synthase [Cupriavidus yeoncheonensis]CAG2149700.1 4-hydroxy-tetrahydrodipicolinate synthase [Cupriavidus yeoncheonensis]
MWRTEEQGFAAAAIDACLRPVAGGHAPPWGMWLPMVTPMRGAALDLPAAARLAERYARAGVDGLVILGTTGEGGLLSPKERRELAATVLEAVNGAVPVMAGAGGVDTRAVGEQVRHLDHLDLAGYLVAPPYYLRPSDAGIAWHFAEVLKVTQRPLMLYNVPRRTGCAMSLALMRSLLAHPRIVAVKECDAANLREAARRQPFPVFCGDDAHMLDHLLAGGAGAVPASAHIRPELFVRLLHLAETGRRLAAGALFSQLQPLVSLMFSEPNPAPVKAALAIEGWIEPDVRLPMQPASKALWQRLETALASLPAISEEGMREANAS